MSPELEAASLVLFDRVGFDVLKASPRERHLRGAFARIKGHPLRYSHFSEPSWPALVNIVVESR
jgi:hypothetical protein